MQVQSVKIESQKSIFDDKIQYAANFLLEHYEIRISVHDPSKKYIVCKDADRAHIEPRIDRISNHLVSQGINIGDAQLRKILSDPFYIPHVDPVTDYFNRIRGTWNGVSQFDILFSHLKIRAFDDNTPEFYTQRAYNLFKKWMVACVACWLNNDPNDVCLGLIQAVGGGGKSFLFQYILPKELDDYYVESSNNEKNFDIEDVYTKFLLVNFEETEGLNKYTINTFKKCQSNAIISTKERYEPFATKKKRLACSVLNTNFNQENGGFIHPYYGSDTRRFGLIEIDDIDQSYSDIIDIDQLQAEMLTLLESSSFDYKFMKDDYADFNAYNLRYRYETEALTIIQKYIIMPEGKEDGEVLNSTSILQRLIQNPKIKADEMKKVNAQKIGAALTQLGFENKTYRPGGNGMPLKGYRVKFLE